MRRTTTRGQAFRTLTVATAILISTAVVVGNARSSATDHRLALSGRLSGGLCSSAGLATGEAVGDLPGAFELSLDCAEGEVTGGTWRVDVTRRNPDGSEADSGQVTGRVLRGAVSRNAAGVLTGTAVELVVTGGTATYVGVTEGTGVLDFTADPTASPQFAATLQLSF